MDQQQVHLSFDARRVDYIVQVLAQRPYAEVAEVLADISLQIKQQREAQLVQANGADKETPHAPH
jgi:hypothetical protein